MKAKLFFSIFIVAGYLILPAGVHAQELKAVKLLAAQEQSGKPLMQALKERKSSREFSARELPLQMLSDMLWAACGINRPDSGHHTAPTAENSQEIDIYVANKDGLYLFDAKNNLLAPVSSGDIRGLTGEQAFVKEAPVNLIYVADLSRFRSFSPEDKDLYAAADTGFISQNVYLFCASSGLSTVVRGWINKPALAKAMNLKPGQKIILAQTVGYGK